MHRNGRAHLSVHSDHGRQGEKNEQTPQQGRIHTHLPGFVICSEGKREDREMKSYAGGVPATVSMVTNLSDSGAVQMG